MNKHLLFCCLLLMECAAFAVQSFLTTSDVTRIGIRAGHFVELPSGKQFTPLGGNLLHLACLPDGQNGHATFCPGIYDAAVTEKMMTDLAAHGLNTVRAFQVFAVGKGGILESKDAQDISPAYLANIVDFLGAARRHKIHVIFTWDLWLPESTQWRSEAIPAENDYHFLPAWDPDMHTNNFVLSLSSVRTRSNAVLALIREIRKVDSTLLPVVLAWELQNEIHFNVTKEPLKSHPAQFSFAGKTYSLNTSEGLQNFMDDAFIQWCDFYADAIHQADPDALVSASVFSFAAVGRVGPNHLLQDATEDERVPARPRALLRSKLDFIDLHLYASERKEEHSFAENCSLQLQSVEAPQLQQEAARLGKPILIGETGIGTHYLTGASEKNGVKYPFDYRLGLPILRAHLLQLKAAGFAGALIWYYGTSPVPLNQEYPQLDTFPEYQEMLKTAWQE